MREFAAVLIAAILIIPGLALTRPADAQDARLPPDTVVATRGSAAITMADVDAQIAGLPEDVRAGYMDDPQRIERLLTGMLLARQLADEAEKHGLHEQPLFARLLRLQRDALLMNQMVRHHVDNLDEPDFTALARERYQASPNRYRTPERRTIRHISIALAKHEPARAREIAQQVHERLGAGEPFDEIARLFSDDRPATPGPLGKPIGLIEDLEPGKTEKRFDEAAFALSAPGEISPVVETSYGFHVIRLESIKPSARRPFEEVRAQIVKSLRTAWSEARRDEYIASFRDQEIEATPEVVASLRTRFAGGKVPSEGGQ
ncbi:MAG TPA: peptidylprolyl isomerase [Xanthomonadaceae bacterium]|nr:peptidylprolyl isomerase [Xanthomonadaceae bacterium]